METVTFTNMCMIYDGLGNVLVENRTDFSWPGIAFPGGHVEKGESFTEAVIREVREETGLTISAPRLCGIKDWKNENGRYVVLLYKTCRFSGSVTSSEEGEVYWMPLAGMQNAELAKGMSTTLRLFLDDEKSEYYLFPEKKGWKEKII